MIRWRHSLVWLGGRSGFLGLAAGLLFLIPSPRSVAAPLRSPYRSPDEFVLLAGPAAPAAQGKALLLFADSPFGIAVTADGHLRYDVRVTAQGLPTPASLGAYTAFVAWEVTPDLATWRRLGSVANGTSTVGTAESNKFLLVVTAEADSAPASHTGPTVLHGISPSGLLQRFLSHPLFRGISQ